MGFCDGLTPYVSLVLMRPVSPTSTAATAKSAVEAVETLLRNAAGIDGTPKRGRAHKDVANGSLFAVSSPRPLSR